MGRGWGGMEWSGGRVRCRPAFERVQHERWAEKNVYAGPYVGVSHGAAAAARALPGTPVMRRRVHTGAYILFNTDITAAGGGAKLRGVINETKLLI